MIIIICLFRYKYGAGKDEEFWLRAEEDHEEMLKDANDDGYADDAVKSL